MAEPSETSPLITAGEASGAIPRNYYTSSAPSNFMVSPGSAAYSAAFQRRRQHLRRARGTGRAIPGNGVDQSPQIISPAGATPREADEDDPISAVRVEMPYQRLQEKNPGAGITRRAMTKNEWGQIPNDNYRHKYFDRLRSAMRHHHSNTTINEDLEEGNEDHASGPDPFDSFLVNPHHTIPAHFYQLHFPTQHVSTDEDSKSSSLVTILSLWNTMMGTSLLAMPWAVSQAGLIGGILLSSILCIIALSTALLILKLHRDQEQRLSLGILEFPQLIKSIFGNRAYCFPHILTACSIFAVTGACTVYWMLMTNFMYNTVKVIKDVIESETVPTLNSSLICVVPPPEVTNITANLSYQVHSLLAPGGVVLTNITNTVSSNTFEEYWNPTLVAIYLVVLIAPVICLDSVGFFGKLNAIGTINVFCLIGIVIYFASKWGINANFTDYKAEEYMPLFLPKTSFCLTGTLALGLFIHNCIITIMRNNYNQQNNSRDAGIGFFLVVGTYLFIGVLYYLTFPLRKECIADNFLNNFHRNNLIIVIERGLMFIQLFTVFPLVMYILRSQLTEVLSRITRIGEKSLFYTINFCALGLFVLLTIFVPSISLVIRFAGAGCGMVIIFIGPILTHLYYMHQYDCWSTKIMIVEVFVMILGIINFIMQFFAP